MKPKRRKEPVKLRFKDLANGNKSIYLDVYANGQRKYEFLKLYLVPEVDRYSRKQNERTLSVAETVRAQRLVELQKGAFGFSNKGKDILFLSWLQIVAKRKRMAMRHPKKGLPIDSLIAYVKRFSTKNYTLADITPMWVGQFSRWLAQSDLYANTQRSYLSQLHSALRIAEKENLIRESPMKDFTICAPQKTERVYLSLEELKAMANTPYENIPEPLRKAFLFSCLTGLRKSDIETLKWKEVSTYDGFTRLTFDTYKTNELQYLDINEQAAALMGEKGRPNDLVFKKFYNVYSSTHLRKWAKAAGIDKPLTFHSGRHTFAVMMLTLDTDIYTVSKLLGHTDVKTTQIYAKIVDKKKQAAVSKIPTI